MDKPAYICQSIAVVILFGVALCADSIMDTYGPGGFLLRSGACIGVASVLVFVGNGLDRRKKENRPVYRKYTGRRGKRYR